MDNKQEKYIKISNSGEVDLKEACEIIGGSIKIKEETIGMFGSGLKYALAQAIRQNIKIILAIGENKIYSLSTYEKIFRDTIIKMLCFKDSEDNIYKTPIAINYGQYDWTEKWFVFREIYSNAMDENEIKIELVDEINNNKNETSFFLMYKDFSDIYENLQDYFCDNTKEWIRSGKGNVYKNGVFIGNIDGLNLDWQNNSISVSESRQVNQISALFNLGLQLSKCTDNEIFSRLLLSPKKGDIRINFKKNENVQLALKEALEKTYGEYAIAPEDELIKKDLEIIGITPVIIPEKWKIDMRVFPSYKKKINPKSNQLREPNVKEKEMIEWGIEIANTLSIKTTDLTFFIISENFKFEGIQGDDTIYLREDIFSNKEKFLITFLHELGHYDSGASDYDRLFAEYFIKKIVDFVI